MRLVLMYSTNKPLADHMRWLGLLDACVQAHAHRSLRQALPTADEPEFVQSTANASVHSNWETPHVLGTPRVSSHDAERREQAEMIIEQQVYAFIPGKRFVDEAILLRERECV